MITKRVTKRELNKWKSLWENSRELLKPNRISGAELNRYFIDKYSPERYENRAFWEIVKLNDIEKNGKTDVKDSNTICYSIYKNVFVGIDVSNSFFHIESEDIDKCIPSYDDLFVKRGLNEGDINNYVIAGQYLELKEQ